MLQNHIFILWPQWKEERRYVRIIKIPAYIYVFSILFFHSMGFFFFSCSLPGVKWSLRIRSLRFESEQRLILIFLTFLLHLSDWRFLPPGFTAGPQRKLGMSTPTITVVNSLHRKYRPAVIQNGPSLFSLSPCGTVDTPSLSSLFALFEKRTVIEKGSVLKR